MDVDRNNKPTGTLTASFTGMCDDVTTKNRGSHGLFLGRNSRFALLEMAGFLRCCTHAQSELR